MKKIEFQSLKIRRATDVIENRISGLIINGNIRAGEKLPTEKELSEQFDVSIVTIREALRGLEVAGMIQKKRGKGGGVYVTEIDNESIIRALHNFFLRSNFSARHLAEVRLMIEPTIVRNIAGKLPENEARELEENVSFCEAKLERAKGSLRLHDYRALGERHLEFHKLIAQATSNPVLVLTMDYLLDFISDFKKSMFSPDLDFSRRLVKEHRGILEAVKKGQAKEAGERMLAHLQYLEKYQMAESP